MKKSIAKKVAVPLLPGAVVDGVPATLGVMGGGQLGRMFVHAAQALGFQTAVHDPDADSPAGSVSHHHIQTDYLDDAGLAQLAQCSHAITTEFENVPAAALEKLAALRPVSPAAQAVRIAQDRAAEKAHFERCGVACAPYAVIETAAQLQKVDASLLPGILKTSRLGYDGKGQIRVKNRAELAKAWVELKGVPCVLEKKLALQAECSVIVARGRDGEIVNLPVNLNTHIDGILAKTEIFKANMPLALAKRAVLATKSIANELNYVGVLCVEFFIVKSGNDGNDKKGTLQLIVNEIAPRPHNSGHHSMNSCDISQFELQVRTLAGLPLSQPRQHSPAIMLNLLGDLWLNNWGQIPIKSAAKKSSKKELESDPNYSPPWAKVLALPGTHLHLYGKTQARRGRKMGHLNITGKTIADVRATASQAAKLLGIKL